MIVSHQTKKIHPDKSRGQNFLIDKSVLAKIIAAAELKKTDAVAEIGAGTGVLTVELAKRAGRALAFEIDKKLIPILRENLKDFKNVEIIEGDVLERHCGEPRIYQGRRKYKLVANIPYNITSAILEKFLSAQNKPSLMILLAQKEVAERICARPEQMSFLSVMVQYYGKPEIVAVVPPSAFWPRPKVESAILKIAVERRVSDLDGIASSFPISSGTPRDDVFDRHFFKVVKAGFSRRRKMLKNNLKEQLAISEEIKIVEILKSVGLSSTVRPQELSVEEWVKLAKELVLSFPRKSPIRVIPAKGEHSTSFPRKSPIRVIPAKGEHSTSFPRKRES